LPYGRDAGRAGAATDDEVKTRRIESSMAPSLPFEVPTRG